jgi:hypothetical protein
LTELTCTTYNGNIGFNELTQPLTSHYNQAQGYAWLRYFEHRKGLDTIRELPDGFDTWPTFKKTIIFFYVNKNGGGKPFKEFSVPLDKAAWKLITSRISQIQEDEAAGRLAPRIAKCGTLAAAKRICGVADLCFGEDDEKE